MALCSCVFVNQQINTETYTLGDLIRNVVKGQFGLVAPSITVGTNVIYEEGEDCDDFSLSLPKFLSSCGVIHGVTIDFDDFATELVVRDL